MSRPTPPTYKTRNWPAYNQALKRRGSLTIWFDPTMKWKAAPTGKRGRQADYSDAAIQTCLTMKVLFGMALRGAVRQMRTGLHSPYPVELSGSEKAAPLGESGGAGLPVGVAILEVALCRKVVVDRGMD